MRNEHVIYIYIDYSNFDVTGWKMYAYVYHFFITDTKDFINYLTIF